MKKLDLWKCVRIIFTHILYHKIAGCMAGNLLDCLLYLFFSSLYNDYGFRAGTLKGDSSKKIEVNNEWMYYNKKFENYVVQNPEIRCIKVKGLID